MGNRATRESSGAHPTTGNNTRPQHLADIDYSSTFLGQDAFAEDQLRIYLQKLSPPAWQKTVESHTSLQRQGHAPETTQKRDKDEERRKAEQAREMQARLQEYEAMRERARQDREQQYQEKAERQARQELEQQEERRKAEEARVRQERERRRTALQEEEKLRLEEKRRLEKEMQEMQRKAEEVRERKNKEKEYKALQDKERLRLAEERLEMQRKAREFRDRQEREHKIKIIQQERLRQVMAMALDICRYHNSRQGCSDPDCRRLHICRLFLADICKHGVSCCYNHSLTTGHNQTICKRNNLDIVRERVLVKQLRLAFEENNQLPETMYINNLETCYRFCSRSSCNDNECNRIHICRQYIAGFCGRADCMFGHSLHATHNNGVLSRHRLRNRRGKEILDILRQKENGETQRFDGAASSVSGAKNGATSSVSGAKNGAASSVSGAKNVAASSVSGAKNGAVPRHPPPGAGNQPSQPRQAPDDLSEELQCPVCLEMFCRATTLGCGHTFCADCLQEVRAKSGDNCPLCRAHISSAIRSVTLDNIIRSISANQ